MRLVLSVAALALSQPTLALAQSAPPSDAPDGWTMQLGGALIAGPAWQGSDDTAVSLFPDVRVSYGDRFFASIPEGVGYNLISSDAWRAGPIAKIRFGRDEEDGGSPFRVSGESNELRGLGDIDTAGEVGAFVERRFGDAAEWRLRGEVRQGFGGHQGVVADASLTYQTRLGSTLVSLGPRLSFASEDYMQTYFGIDPAQSAGSGLAVYRADGGLLSYGLGASVIQPLSRNSAVTLFGSVERLGDAAADSPLIRDRGSETQATVGIGYGFRFSL